MRWGAPRRIWRLTSRTGVPGAAPETVPATVAPRPRGRVSRVLRWPRKRILTGVIARVTAGSQPGDWLAVVIWTGPYVTVFVSVASVTSSRTECGPSASSAVFSEIVPEAERRQGTALVNGSRQRPPLSSTTCCHGGLAVDLERRPVEAAAAIGGREGDAARARDGAPRVEQVARRRADERGVEPVGQRGVEPVQRHAHVPPPAGHGPGLQST